MNSNLALVSNQQIGISTPSAQDWAVMREQAGMLTKTGFLPQSIKTPEQAVAIMLQGRELGIPAMAALTTINVIQGKPTVSPQLMLALINRSGQIENLKIEANGNSVSCSMKRKGREWHTEVFGEKEAIALGLAGKDNYKKQPMTMYRWRAVASCARTVFPDVVLGLYTPDEMGANVNEEGEILAPPPAPIQSVPPPAQTQPKKTETAQEDPVNKRLAELCNELNNAGDSIKWTGKTLTEYANELLDDSVKNFMQLDDEKKQVLLGDLEGRLSELTIAVREEIAIDGEVVEEAPDAAKFADEVF